MTWGANQPFFAETPEGGKSTDSLLRYPRRCRGSWGVLLQSLRGIFFLGQTKVVLFSFFFPAFATDRAYQHHKGASHLDSCTSSVCLSRQPDTNRSQKQRIGKIRAG